MSHSDFGPERLLQLATEMSMECIFVAVMQFIVKIQASVLAWGVVLTA